MWMKISQEEKPVKSCIALHRFRNDPSPLRPVNQIPIWFQQDCILSFFLTMEMAERNEEGVIHD